MTRALCFTPTEALYFASGASAPHDIEGFSRILHPIGVSVPELSPTTIAMLCERAHLPWPVFVDSGAFSEVDDCGRIVAPIDEAEWAQRVAVMLVLAKALGPRAYIVAPDCVGDQLETLARLTRHAIDMRLARSYGARIIVPIQRGHSPASIFDAEVERVLGFNDFIRGIPGNKIAMPPDELEVLLRERRPAAVHLLGVGPKGDRYRPMIDVLRRLAPDAEVSCDSNALSAATGRANGKRGGTRLLTAWQDHIEGRPSRVAEWAIGKPAEPPPTARADAIVMTFGPPLFYEKAMLAYEAAGLPVVRLEWPLQTGLFDGVKGNNRGARRP